MSAGRRRAAAPNRGPSPRRPALRPSSPRCATTWIASIVLGASLNACKAVGPDFSPPGSPRLSGYGAPGEAEPALQHVALGAQVADDWWRAFRSPELDRVMRLALAGNPSLQAADATLGEYRADLSAARGQRLPQADVNAAIERERLNFSALGFNSAAFPGIAINNNPTFPLYSVGATVSYTLDLWGGVRRGIETAEARAQAQARRADAAYLTLTGDVATQAALIAATRAEIATVQSVLASDQRNLALVRQAQAAGGVAEEARVNASAQIAADSTLLPPLQRQLAAARHDLALLVGRAPASWTAPDFDIAALPLPTEIPVSLPSTLVHERPDILQAEADLHAATAQIGVQTARLYPSINLSAALTQSALQPGNVFSWSSDAYTLGAGLTAPIFHGGEIRAQRRAAVEVELAAAASYRQTVVRAFTQVAALMAELAEDEAALTAAERQQATAQATLRLNQLAYRAGGAGLLPVVDSQRQVDTAQLAVVRVQAQRYLDTIQLFVATGHGWRGGSG